ncbi:nucleotidyl transferase AbiEii/AbiGii toxin family protein [Hydrogenivirga sp. 128-5-R1-1]|uniref:nucleotidyl transferase AbiEii/AbiGii toxin family protein n=1 Tax=Hydrogenivirga sp. 128-5-R1-1 TaxID=392423 RepID=UPI00015EF123|nr:nucleotidyl transferase AbiEii/AbiGii toxin family protein [Hydrogenivirga sp. 128-5-R1-1]EDP74669.1 hypothetical protein HG1285_14694 [Hydrogenivirga sp. 128-5-R1-1]
MRIGIIYHLQELVLERVNEVAGRRDFPFLFTGGTALARFLLDEHRVSYDIDFFCKRGSVRGIELGDVKEALEDLGKVKVQRFERESEEDTTIEMVRFTLEPPVRLPDGSALQLKVEFVEDELAGLFEGSKMGLYPNLEIDSLEGICARKVVATLSRNLDRYRDYLDLMYIEKETENLEEFLEVVKEKTGVSPENVFESFSFMLEALRDEKYRSEVDTALRDTYYTEVGAKELEEWIREKTDRIRERFGLSLPEDTRKRSGQEKERSSEGGISRRLRSIKRLFGRVR